MTAMDKSSKILESIMRILKIDKLPRGSFVEGFGSVAYVRYNGNIQCKTDDDTEMSDELADEMARKILEREGVPKYNGSPDFLAPDDLPPCLRSRGA